MDSSTLPGPGVEDHEWIDSIEVFSNEDFFRCSCLAWLRGIEEEESCGMVDERSPKDAPDYLVLHTDIVEKGWGFKRLVPCRFGDCVEWPDFRNYLVWYYEKNREFNEAPFNELVGKPGPVKQRGNGLRAAVNKLVQAEYKLIKTCGQKLVIKDLELSWDIRHRARKLLQSGCESLAAAAALHCITKEDDLLCALFLRQDISKELAFANVIRKSASNLMLFKGSDSESDAAAAAAGIMLGLAREAEEVLNVLNNRYQFAMVNYLTAMNIRRRVVGALTKLEEELMSKTCWGWHSDRC